VAGSDDSRGLAAAFVAYGLWGVFPLYFHLLEASGAVEIVAHRIVWALVFCLIGITVVRGWPTLLGALRQRRLVGTLLGAGVLVSLNWLIYVYAVVTDRVVDSSLGYFMNPLVTVLLAVIFLHEKLRRAQAAALAIGLVAVAVIVVGMHQFPWIGISLALSFGLYSLAKNRVGGRATPLVGLGIETSAMTPVALVYLVVLQATGHATLTAHGPGYALLLVGTGVVTAVPLLAFAAGAARLSLVTLAMIQYITPTMGFLIGVVLYHEQMGLARWIGFLLIWVALVVLTWDLVAQARSHRLVVPTP
jgi:chloramphenicol-sensitive protein RarD